MPADSSGVTVKSRELDGGRLAILANRFDGIARKMANTLNALDRKIAGRPTN